MSGANSDQGPRQILLANRHEDELDELAGLLREEGFEVVALAVTIEEVAENVAREEPDLAMVLVEDDVQHGIDLLTELRSFAEIPLVVLSNRSDDELLEAAAEQGLEVFRLPPSPRACARAVEHAWKRHAQRRALEDEVSSLESALKRRAVIERAKGVLMERHGLSEAEAFARIRDYARSKRLRVVSVAEAVLTARELLPGAGDAEQVEATSSPD